MQDKDSDQGRRVPAAWRRPAWPARLGRPALFRRPTFLRGPVRSPRHTVLGLAIFGAAFAAAVLGGLAWGRPHVMWHFRTADNRLTLGLAAGHGPFAGWLLSRSSVAASGHHGRQVLLSLRPGSTSRVTPTVISVWAAAAAPITVHVPPAPAITRRTITRASVAVRFSLPVTIDSAPCRPSPPAAAIATVRFTRGIRACAGTMQVSAASGEMARMPVTVPALTPDPVTFFGPPDDRAVYITIDDGWFPSEPVLRLMHARHVPVTAFLISSAAAGHLGYWRSFQAAGGVIEDHTISHPDLSKLSLTAATEQWAGAARALHTWFGLTPTLGRPPYGGVTRKVLDTARLAGLRKVVMWSAEMAGGRLSTYDHRPLRAGEIVILHWVPGLYHNLSRLLHIAAARGLHPEPLPTR
jgi:peptidoglycan/xylan/chitin deacetylase (PgdA/CDA1 family)